jgi:thiol-disulfide isomerase/thioredoxin
MPAVPSTMLPLGTPLPAFTLTDVVTGRIVRAKDFDGQVGLVMILCNHCPYVKHVQAKVAELARDYSGKGVQILGLSPNDVERYPQDGPDAMAIEAQQAGYVFPYCLDETQEVAKAFRAACTPEFYVFSRAGLLVYRGQLDESRPSSGVPVTGTDLRRALDAALADRTPEGEQKASIGCSIKWKPGAEPDY